MVMPDGEDKDRSGLCGEPTGNDTPCKRPAGQGIDGRDWGPCSDHTSERSVIPKGGDTETKITPKRRATITTTIRDGRTKRMAAQRAGISPATLERWLDRGEAEDTDPEQPKTVMHEFYLDVMEARAKAKEEILRDIEEAGEDDWRMHTWKAERLYPYDFAEDDVSDRGPDTTVTHTVETDIDDGQREFIEQVMGGDDDADVVDVESREVDDDSDDENS